MADEKNVPVLGASWKTTLAGTILALMVVLGAVHAALTGDFSKVDFTQVAQAIGALAAAFGLLSARDNKVTSEAAGAVPK